ncbi:natural cytotoxicity triggering receptor 3 ligand 1-like [Fukomys damarensis]|uniref:natural cytotoxicity triggering receptor 3 ligand 1-like n=1 Tax=Fukomys damarensis TaxID=885580 RepID=UPI00053F89D5|nr:natural cytotoxicity triggering receptor 3 ligand 1-like [Fukomys damarensis]
MPGRSQIAYVNGNVTLSCQVPGCPSLDTRIMGVTWYRKDLVSEAEVKVFELYGDQQNAFRCGAMVSAQRLKRGDASLQLPGVGLGDAGEYRCELTVTPQKAKGWVLLEVLAKPDSTVFLEKTKVSGKGRHLVCQSSGFYPEAINITWEKWTQKVPQHQVISKDICTGPTIKNKDGVFSITSYLKLNASLEDNGTIYQCVVEHPSLSISQKVNFTLLVIEAEKICHTWILFFSCFGLILMLFLFLCIWRR